MDEVQRHSVHTLIFRSLKRTHDIFVSNQGALPAIDEKLEKVRKAIKARDSYGLVFNRVIQAAEAKKYENSRVFMTALEGPEKPLAITDGSIGVSHSKDSNMVLLAANNKNGDIPVSSSLVSAPGMRSASGASNVQLIPKKSSYYT